MSLKFEKYVTHNVSLLGRNATAKSQILLLMAKRADDDGLVEVSKTEIIAATGINYTRVVRVIQRLVQEGHLELVQEGGTGERPNLPNVFRIVMHKPRPLMVDGQERLELPETARVDREWLPEDGDGE